MCAQPLSRVRLFMIPWSIAHQVPLSMGFPRQEYWNGLPYFLLQGIFLTHGSNLCFLYLLHWQADSLPLSHLGSPRNTIYLFIYLIPCHFLQILVVVTHCACLGADYV